MASGNMVMKIETSSGSYKKAIKKAQRLLKSGKTATVTVYFLKAVKHG